MSWNHKQRGLFFPPYIHSFEERICNWGRLKYVGRSAPSKERTNCFAIDIHTPSHVFDWHELCVSWVFVCLCHVRIRLVVLVKVPLPRYHLGHYIADFLHFERFSNTTGYFILLLDLSFSRDLWVVLIKPCALSF